MSETRLSAVAVRETLEKHGLRAKKCFGQNFLTDPAAVRTVVSAVDPGPEDLIIEIGPGLGALTVPLAERAGRVVAVELDGTLIPALRSVIPASGDVSVIKGDFLRLDLDTVIKGNMGGLKHLKIAGSLPYYITTPILEKIWLGANRPERVVVIMQKEASDRITAGPGRDGYGVMTLLTALNAVPSVLKIITPDAFRPQPGVDSAVVLFETHTAPVVSADKIFLMSVVKAAFSTRRKTLLNCLTAGGYDRDAAAAAIEICGLSADVRGERLSLPDFDRLCGCIALSIQNA